MADTDMTPDRHLELYIDEVDAARTAVQLLTEVEELSRPLPLWRADLAHSSQLVVDLCDLLREAKHLGYHGPWPSAQKLDRIGSALIRLSLGRAV